MATNSIYPAVSPYYLSSIYENNFLDVMINRTIPMSPSDVHYEIPIVYQYRPDLLAYDLYNDPGLWWVFAQRNPNKLKDPLFDFVSGISIYVPKLETLKAVLGF